jgi:phosphatidylinositol alpha-1,6-mannosyltransferase
VTGHHRRRVLVLTPDYPPTHGGIQLLLARLVGEMRRFEAHVVTLGGNGASPGGVRRLEPPGGSRRLGVVVLNVASVAEARAVRPDVVLSGHIVCAPAAAILRRAGLPVVQYLYANEVAARPRLARFACEQADVVVAISAFTASLARRAGIRMQRLRVIPPGVDLPHDLGEVERGDRPTILTIARMDDRYKGHDVLVRALPLVRAAVPNVAWIVMGDGRVRPLIERLVEAYGVGEVAELLGERPDGERDDWLRRAHVFAMPSREAPTAGGEGFGIVYLEAGAYGLPVVAGRAGGAPEAVVDGETGVLVDPSDHVELADAIVALLADPARARSLGRAGRAHAESFAWPKIARRVEAALDDAIENRL